MVNRNLQDWQIEQYENLLSLLAEFQPTNKEDQLHWSLGNNGKLLVKTFYHHLAGHNRASNSDFLEKMIWKSNALPCITFFTRKAAKQWILTIDNLMKRGITLSNRCFLCKENAESCNHLLLHCPFTQKLLTIVHGLLGIKWIIASSIKDELKAREFLRKGNKKCRLIPLIIFWIIWKEKKQ